MSKHIFDPIILKQANITQTFSGKKDATKRFRLRPLESDDYNRGFLQMLAELTKVGEVCESKFREQFQRMADAKGYYVTVIEDLDTGSVVGSCTLFIEYKFIHNTALRGRVEDVVVLDEYRGQGLGNVLIDTVKALAVHLKCYKLTLDCNDEMIPFYQRFDFKAEPGRANSMTIRYS